MTDERDPLAGVLRLAVHELRTPTAVIAGYLRLLLRHFDGNLTDQQRKLLEASERSCVSLTDLLSELSDLAELSTDRPAMRRQAIPVVGLLKQAAAEAERTDDRGVRLEVIAPDGEPVVLGDPDRLRAALVSLAAAVLRERQKDALVAAACAPCRGPQGDLAVIAFAEPEEAGRLAGPDGLAAGPFDKCRGGLGFRLPLAARIVEAHGGSLSSPVAERGRLAIVVSLPLATNANARR